MENRPAKLASKSKFLKRSKTAMSTATMAHDYLNGYPCSIPRVFSSSSHFFSPWMSPEIRVPLAIRAGLPHVHRLFVSPPSNSCFCLGWSTKFRSEAIMQHPLVLLSGWRVNELLRRSNSCRSRYLSAAASRSRYLALSPPLWWISLNLVISLNCFAKLCSFMSMTN